MSEVYEFQCPKCGRKYQKSDFKVFESLKCKDCRSRLWVADSEDDVQIEEVDVESSDEIRKTLKPKSAEVDENSWGFEDLVLAQDRTTHAVRSLASFFFISVCSTGLGYGIISFGAGFTVGCAGHGTFCDNTLFTLGGWAVIAVGFFVALGVGISELNKSRIS